MESRWPMTDVGAFKKIMGTSGGSKGDSSMCFL